MSKNDGGPAHPTLGRSHIPGMTLRDYFAGQALAGTLANSSYDTPMEMDVGYAYRVADAMIAERDKD